MTNRIAALVLCSAALFAPRHNAVAYNSEDYYLDALKIADQHVQKRKARIWTAAFAPALSLIQARFGRSYRVGDFWEVAAEQRVASMAKRTSDRENSKEQSGVMGIFRYEVIEIREGEKSEAVIRITQLAKWGVKVVDPNVQSLTLQMDQDPGIQAAPRQLTLFERTASRTSSKRISFQSSMLEFFPLDFSDPIHSQHGEPATWSPPLKGQLLKLAKQSGWKLNISSTVVFEESDFFGRPVKFFWQAGSPWPSYLETPQGFAILLSQGEA